MELFDYIDVDNYNETRNADDKILNVILDYLNLNALSKCLDVGCGTGNYTIETYKRGYPIVGLDPSKTMLEKARSKCDGNVIELILDCVEEIPYTHSEFDGVFSVCAIHHFKDIDLAFKEIYRVLKDNGKLVMFTSTHIQIDGYWLNHYFPRIIKNSKRNRLRNTDVIASKLMKAGFKNIETKIYVTDEKQKIYFLIA